MPATKTIHNWKFPSDYYDDRELIYTLYTDLYSQWCDRSKNKDEINYQVSIIIFHMLENNITLYNEWLDFVHDNQNILLDRELDDNDLECIGNLFTTITCMNLENKVGPGVIKWDE